MRLINSVIGLSLAAAAWLPLSASAAMTAPAAAADATAYVVCGNRQGSGAYLAGDHGYILTAGHVVEDPDTHERATTCEVAFGSSPNWSPSSVFSAEVVFVDYDARLDRDFALLKVTNGLTRRAALPAASFKVSETVAVGDAVDFLGYPSGQQDLESSVGKILGFRRGVIRTDAAIAAGYSGGPIIDSRGRLIGLATRLIVVTDGDGKEVVQDYEAVDLLSLENWLDTEQGGHDQFIVHDEPSFVHGSIPLVRQEEPPCSYLVRTKTNSAVYCLVPGMGRLTFPSAAVFSSWYSDFKSVQQITDQNLTDYSLVANMTFKAGSLVKIATDPKVYFVADNMGTLRWLTSETTAERLFGSAWSKQIHDIPDTFFLNYRLGRQLD